MKKNKIRLTESQLHRVIRQSVTRILKEKRDNSRIMSRWEDKYSTPNDEDYSDVNWMTDYALEELQSEVNRYCDNFEENELNSPYVSRGIEGIKQRVIADFEEAEGIIEDIQERNLDLHDMDMYDFVDGVCSNYGCSSRVGMFAASIAGIL